MLRKFKCAIGKELPERTSVLFNESLHLRFHGCFLTISSSTVVTYMDSLSICRSKCRMSHCRTFSYEYKGCTLSERYAGCSHFLILWQFFFSKMLLIFIVAEQYFNLKYPPGNTWCSNYFVTVIKNKYSEGRNFITLYSAAFDVPQCNF